MVQPAEAIEQCRLAGAVGADQAGNLPGHHVKGDIVQGDHAAKTQGYASHGQKRRRIFRHRIDTSPSTPSWIAGRSLFSDAIPTLRKGRYRAQAPALTTSVTMLTSAAWERSNSTISISAAPIPTPRHGFSKP